MIRRDSGRSKFISLLMVLTMVFSMIMPMGAWAAPAVTSMVVDTVPTKIVYTEGEQLDLAGLIVMLTKSDTTTSSVAFVDFVTEGITTTPAQNGALTLADTSVTITHIASGVSTSQAITVNSAPPTLYTLSTTGEGLTTTPAAGQLAVGTSVTVNVVPPLGKIVDTFTVGGVDKKADLLAAPANQYTFNMPAANTSVVVTYITTTNVVDISTPNSLLVGDYLFSLNVANAKYNLNNFIKASQTTYNSNPSGYPQYHVYLYAGEINGTKTWFDLVTDPDLKHPIIGIGISQINGNGKYKYTEADLQV